MAKYTLYIDESGDAGIRRVRNNVQGGATPYFVFGAVLIKNDTYEIFCQVIREIAAMFGADFLHCNRLDHAQKKYFARTIARQPMMLFGSVSRKETLGEYKEYIQADVMRYHNKCAGYLLECVGEFLANRDIDAAELDIYFERGPFDYDALCNYVRYCQQDPIYPRNRLLQHIEAHRIRTRTKDEEPLFQVSDLVAHALFKTVDINDRYYQIPEPQYFIELHKRFYHHPKTLRLNEYGFKAINGVYRAQIPQEVRVLLNEFRGESLLET